MENLKHMKSKLHRTMFRTSDTFNLLNIIGIHTRYIKTCKINRIRKVYPLSTFKFDYMFLYSMVMLELRLMYAK